MVKYRCNVNQCIRQKKDKNLYADYSKFMDHLLHSHTPKELAVFIAESQKEEIVSQI
jgi:hypothetical protein